jgi:predicted DNA-binding transcriptional regulator AlpA
MSQLESPLVRVSEASKTILLEKPSATYDKIRREVFPLGVVVRLGERSIRFHRENLLKWLASGGSHGNGVRAEQAVGDVQVAA